MQRCLMCSRSSRTEWALGGPALEHRLLPIRWIHDGQLLLRQRVPAARGGLRQALREALGFLQHNRKGMTHQRNQQQRQHSEYPHVDPQRVVTPLFTRRAVGAVLKCGSLSARPAAGRATSMVSHLCI